VSAQSTGEQPDPERSMSGTETGAGAGTETGAGSGAPDAHAEAVAAAVVEVEGAANSAAAANAASVPAPVAGGTSAGTGGGSSGDGEHTQHAKGHSGFGSRVHQLEPDEHSPLAVLHNAISANFRRALMASAMACVGLGLTYISGGVLNNSGARVDFFNKHSGLGHTAAVVGAILFLIFGVIAVRSATNEILKTVPPSLGDNRKNGLRWFCLLVGYVVVIFGTLGALNVPIERLLVGGAVTGVIVGIAAQQSLGNLFAGLMLLLTRPFAIGDEISLRSGPLGGVLTGLVADMNLTYVKLVTDHGTILLPNAALLTAAVGPPGVFD
jgi:hypothetical protein